MHLYIVFQLAYLLKASFTHFNLLCTSSDRRQIVCKRAIFNKVVKFRKKSFKETFRKLLKYLSETRDILNQKRVLQIFDYQRQMSQFFQAE